MKPKLIVSVASTESPETTRMVHLGFWLPLLAFPMVGAVLQTIQLRQTIIANCDLIFAVTSNPLCLNDAFINVCSNFFVMAEICRWTRCNFIPQYPDFALLEVVEFSDIAGYQQLVNFCGANNVPLCQFARTMLQLAQQCNSGKLFFIVRRLFRKHTISNLVYT